MSCSVSYNAVNTKIKAMRAKLLNRDNYVDMSKSKNVEGVVDKLKKTSAYKRTLESIEPEKMHRGYIESKLVMSVISDFERIYNFISDTNLKKYLNAFFLRNEIYALKLVLSMIYDKRELDYDLSGITKLFGTKNLELTKIPSNLDELANSLKHTEFYDLLNISDKRSNSLFDLQMRLDIYYYTHLWDLQKKYLSGDDLKVLKKITGTQIDLLNIIWLWRVKKYYKFDNADLYYYVIPVSYNLSQKEISVLINSDTIDSFINAVSKTHYGYIFKNNGENKPQLESVFYKSLSRLYYKFYMRFEKNITDIVYYIYLKEHEVNNITSVIEGVRYGLPYEEIIKRLHLQEVINN